MISFIHKMIKELLLAIILGSLLGFSLTGGVIALKKNKTNQSVIVKNTGIGKSVSETKSKPDPEPSSSVLSETTSVDTMPSLVIDTPQNESVSDKSLINIQGTTTPNSLVVASTTLETLTTNSDESGKFIIENFELEAGLNYIQLSSVSQNDTQNNTEIQVTFSTVKF